MPLMIFSFTTPPLAADSLSPRLPLIRHLFHADARARQRIMLILLSLFSFRYFRCCSLFFIIAAMLFFFFAVTPDAERDA
jgi:hypothetical protein